ncbi:MULTISPECIES: prepilin-type cleavage/methylation domain-containing protein [Alteromonadaceae]|uniref:prepilin-type cleavage/methylation domain-containing protein n=1 Tax=Alteromonadaceae TaxID=72275 RepID=UPI0026E1AA74|nr:MULTISPECIES: prepilin-type cleavage/methylation domain-containing protein [unclassified Aliiglaciecola]MDO6713217.1 prepilin-type cleavage/methylation domain-containing protein [Aliiglaciecola sp. 2_MG-2023]MDO6754345.1 prepilin-type cleavage/methylation domain-containing protein [Aliiglaciecola sp. 1_MG-2023]
MRTSSNIRSAIGFTIVELVVVIIILGILTVVVAPRFQTGGGLAEYTYQARLISSLRTMQQRAMNDTRDSYCFQVNVFTGANSSFGPPTLVYKNSSRALSCATTIDTSEDAAYVVANIDEMDADNVTITSGGGSILFNRFGCANNGSGFCANDIEVVLQGESAVSVCIESQGYIHACE